MAVRITRILPVALLLLAGCVTDSVETSTGRSLPPEPRKVQPPPATAPINAMAMLKDQRPVDTNGNGFPNRLNVAVYLFSRPYPSPRHARGSLVFHYYPVGSVDPVIGASQPPLATWTFGPDVLAATAIENIIGPGYELTLDISAIGLSEIDATGADLVVEFLSEDGQGPVRNSTVQRVPFVVY
ncbi:MAG: hypothetical protein CMJ34_06225 [Phycisphaerae bacterium]|nr:hypothetical protein [Phycisphaerae bacterium]